MSTLARPGEEAGPREQGLVWPIVAVVAAAILAVAPLYLEVLVMNARLAAAEQSVDKLVARTGASTVARWGR